MLQLSAIFTSQFLYTLHLLRASFPLLPPRSAFLHLFKFSNISAIYLIPILFATGQDMDAIVLTLLRNCLGLNNLIWLTVFAL
jgi:hypothetical protein